MNKALLVVLSALLALSACAASSRGDQPEARDARDGLAISKNLGIDYADSRVSCNGRIMVIWGQTRERLPVGAPPYVEVYVVNMSDGQVLNKFTTTRGPFDVEFDEKINVIVIDDFLLNAKDGKILHTEIPSGLVLRPCTPK